MIIKKYSRYVGLVTGLAELAIVFTAASTFAAGVVLTNGGMGQIAGNTQSFGIAICNGSSEATMQAVPIAITANGKTLTASSPVSIQPGVCSYTYVAYAQFGMSAGQTYSVDVTLDPSHSIISNSNNEAQYSVTVPGSPVAEVQQGTTSGSENNSNFVATIGTIFANFFAYLKNLF